MNTRSLFVIGATHRTAPFDFREKMALSAEAESCLARDLGSIPGLHEFAILNTCNRMEIYGAADRSDAAAEAASAFFQRRGVDPSEWQRYGFRMEDREALRHLLEVAAGIDSQMLGETEIFGQVKRAYASAQARGSTGPVLNRVFQKAFQAAKRARTETAITSGQVSVSNVAVDLALNVFGSLGEVRILLLGAGEIGEKSAKACQSRGASRLVVSSRRPERARSLAGELGAESLPFEDRERRLSDFDIVLCATSAPGTVISQAAVKAAMAERPTRPLFLIDLAMPRDVEPGVSGMQNVFLYNLDDLALIAEENRIARQAEANRCRTLLAERVTALWPQIEALLGGPVPVPAASGRVPAGAQVGLFQPVIG
jgi:glutamyl-tRNA reductase